MSNSDVVFVFGSNLAGRHGKGAAWDAAQVWGAKYGVGKGRTGDAYAIATKDSNLKVMPLSRIEPQVIKFIEYARDNPKTMFYMTAFGTGLAGHSLESILDMFKPVEDLPYNIVFTKDWIKYE